MSELPAGTDANGASASPIGFVDRDAIVLSPVLEGPASWHAYSVERGNESGLIASLAHGTVSNSGRTLGCSQASWSSHGLWRG
jgi:hypothetical protein